VKESPEYWLIDGRVMEVESRECSPTRLEDERKVKYAVRRTENGVESTPYQGQVQNTCNPPRLFGYADDSAKLNFATSKPRRSNQPDRTGNTSTLTPAFIYLPPKLLAFQTHYIQTYLPLQPRRYRLPRPSLRILPRSQTSAFLDVWTLRFFRRSKLIAHRSTRVCAPSSGRSASTESSSLGPPLSL
jgi:hypothetical protein